MFDQSIEREHFILEAEIIVSQKKKKKYSYSIKKLRNVAISIPP